MLILTICQHCKEQLEVDDKFNGHGIICSNCNKIFRVEPINENSDNKYTTVTEQIITEEKPMMCSNCGEKISIDNKFCPKCRRQITNESNKKHCPKCNNIVPNTANYCPTCSFDLSQTRGTASTLNSNSSKPTESESSVDEYLQVYCPRCKCTQISTIEEQHTDPLRFLLWGIFAFGFKNRFLYNVCKKCGYKWELKQPLSEQEEKEKNADNIMTFFGGIIIIAIIFIIVYAASS